MFWTVEVVEYHGRRKEHFKKVFQLLHYAEQYYRAMVSVNAEKVVLRYGYYGKIIRQKKSNKKNSY